MKRKEKWSEPNLHEDMFQPLIFRVVLSIDPNLQPDFQAVGYI